MGFRLDFKENQKIEADKSYMFCPNHTSLLDPFVLIALSKNPIVFVGKKELVKIPVFGFFYKKVVIMVDRSSLESRKRVFKMAKERLQNGVSMAIFPEGLVPEENVVLAPFKKGAFSLAIEFEIPIVPQTYYDCKRFFSWDIFKGRPGILRVKQHEFITTKNKTIKEDLLDIKEETFAILKNDLENDFEYMKDTNRKK
ncbi:lysophospholipid acyltransferase family protein [uncultured Polaribacter sp.]|uniref:lysophospholipid acyltransferase family protein n=1 Tax=uncultured Polaribacter sp. TaxID=174711 RepID=UPI0034371C5F